MLGRTPGNIIAVRPLRQGVISDYTVTEKMIKYFVQKALGRRTFQKPRISICVPSGVTEVERNAVQQATFAAGARDVYLIEEPVAAAIGAGIDISKACGNLIVDIGGGTTDVAVISLGGTVVSTSLKVAGDDFDEAIVRYMKKKHNLLIGDRTAEDIKIKIGTTYPLIENEAMEVSGRNLVTGLPKTVTVTSAETERALQGTSNQIIEAIISVLERTPPELSADILEQFDYAALGHIHKPMKVGEENFRYCGTPLACSVSEAGQQKGILMVEIKEKEKAPEITVLPLMPLRQVRVIKGSLEEVLQQKSQDYVTVILTDKADLDVIDMQDRLRLAFPYLLEIRRENQRKADYSRGKKHQELQDPFELCCGFLKDMDEEEKNILRDVLNTVQEVK